MDASEINQMAAERQSIAAKLCIIPMLKKVVGCRKCKEAFGR